MKNRPRKLVAVIFGVILTITIAGAGIAYAASISAVDPKTNASANTAEQSRERVNLNEAFEGLTDEQKEEIYDITDESESLKDKLIDKMVEFGVLDQDTVTQMKERHSERYAEIKEEGSMFGGRRGRGGKGDSQVERSSRGGRGQMRQSGDNTCTAKNSTQETPEFEATDNN